MYEFVRRLAKGMPQEQARIAAALLLENGIEVYVRDKKGYAVISDANDFEGEELFVPAADRERAAVLMERIGAQASLCTDPAESLEMTENERLQADLFRRQRRNMVVCLVVMAVAALYFLISPYI